MLVDVHVLRETSSLVRFPISDSLRTTDREREWVSVYVDFNLLVYKIISNESFEIQNHLNFAFNIRHTLFLPIPIYKRLHLIYDDRVFVIGHFKWDDIQTRPNQLELELRLQHFYEWAKVSYHFVGFFFSLSNEQHWYHHFVY